MAKTKDLTGQRFGRLVVLGLNPEPYVSPGGKPARRWDCLCDCGTRLTVQTNVLTGKNGTRSCGCVRREKARANGHDLTGKRFGRLVVLEQAELEAPERNRNRRGWRCRCDCGKEIVTTQKQLELDGVRSCGCLLADTARDKILVKNIMGHFEGTTVSAIRPERPPNKNSTSGVKGVHWSSREQRWIARIGVKGRSITLGRFKNLEDAREARLEAEKKYFDPIIAAYDQARGEPQA